VLVTKREGNNESCKAENVCSSKTVCLVASRLPVGHLPPSFRVCVYTTT
jgi:hypothetical protein